ncbi:MAG: hypothetical protein Q8P63_02310 [Candidatus Nealsonbacteria bacterium]|nr:hypothetical protein [Candidatus Nealsonbacteria bacterium]
MEQLAFIKKITKNKAVALFLVRICGDTKTAIMMGPGKEKATTPSEDPNLISGLECLIRGASLGFLNRPGRNSCSVRQKELPPGTFERLAHDFKKARKVTPGLILRIENIFS